MGVIQAPVQGHETYTLYKCVDLLERLSLRPERNVDVEVLCDSSMGLDLKHM